MLCFISLKGNLVLGLGKFVPLLNLKKSNKKCVVFPQRQCVMCCVVFCVVLCFLRAVCCEDRVPPTVNSTGSDDQPLLSHSTMRPATVSHFTLHRVPTLYQVQLATLKLYFTFPLFSTLCSRLSHSIATAFSQNRTFGSSTPMYVYDVAMKVWHVCVTIPVQEIHVHCCAHAAVYRKIRCVLASVSVQLANTLSNDRVLRSVVQLCRNVVQAL